jgi:hypothetical protein
VAKAGDLLNSPARRAGAALGGAAVLGLIAGAAWFLLGRDGGEPTPFVEPPGFALSPEGDDVPRLAPVKVTFASAPAERKPENLLILEPPAAGTYAWLSDRTVLFQPEYPGLLRGSTYTVRVPARPETGLTEEVLRQFTVTGLLTVQQTLPGNSDTEVPLNAPILVQFSRSVAPLTTLSAEATAEVIEFDPPLEGSGEWLNTSIYRFVPSNLQPYTEYRARIPKGLTSAADGVLHEDYAWKFRTVSPAVAKIVPDNNTEFASPRQQVVVTFNQPMDPVAASGISLVDMSGAKVPGSVAWSENNTIATFTPSIQLGYRTPYDGVVAAGLPGATGGATAEERRVRFTTVGLPGIASSFPRNGETSAQRYGISISFTNPMETDTLEGKVSVSGFSADDLDGNVFISEFDMHVSLTLRPSTSYTVSIAGGAVDRYGQVMGPQTISFTTGALPSQVTLALPGYSASATYSASAEPILYFHATNMDRASFTLYPLTDSEAKGLLHNFYGGPKFEPSLAALRTWSEPVTGAANEVVLGSTSLSGNGQPLPKGYYYVRSSGQYQSDFAFAVVDTVLVTKMSNDELLVWAIEHDTGKPVAGAKVVASGPEITPAQATTDARGLASFKVPPPLLGKNIDRSYFVVLDEGAHRGVTSTRWTQGAAPYQLGIPTDWFAREWAGQVYTDRPIYRPGETVEYKGIVRADDDAAYAIPPSDPPLEFVILNSRGQQVVREGVRTNEFGTFAGSFTIPTDAPVGDYSISIQLKGAPEYGYWAVAGNSFLVAEFRKPEFQVEVETGQPSYVNGDTIDVTTTASFFFGGGVPNAAVEWSVLGSPSGLKVEGYERYSFSDYDYWRTAVSTTPIRASGKALTGPDGVAAYAIPAALQPSEGAQQLTLSATVTDQNAQAVASSATVMVHPASLYAGIRPAEYVAQAGTATTVNLVTVDKEGTILPNQRVTVRVYKRDWITTKEQTPEGARRYKSEPRDTLVSTLTADTDAKGEGSVQVTPGKTGTYRLVAEVTDAQGRTARSAAYLWVWGSEFASWRISNDDTIALVADKDSYEVGETADILVPAPFEGAVGLVTVERGKVFTREVRQFPTNTERLSIPITDRSVPNIFVSVVLYRPPTAEDPVPRYKVGYVQLPVSTETRELTVSIRPDRDQARPGEKVRYDITVTDSAGRGVASEVSVSVVDKALLSLEEERGPDGLRAFWFERGLAVQTSSSMAVSINRSNDVIAEPPRGGKGGGGLDDDRLRQDFRNSAYWSAQLKTDSQGRASVEVTMPDNLTTWRMQVRAVSGDTMVGEGTNELVSTLPLLLRPALPRFLRAGDETRVRLLVRNATGKEQEVKVTISAEGIDLQDKSARTVKVPVGQSVAVSWPAKVTTDGTARLTFSASGGGYEDAVTQEIPVFLDVTPETMATGGIITNEPGVEAVYLPPFAVLKNGLLQVAVQSALTGSMADELKNYEPRPFEDTVYIASRLTANIAVARAARSAGRAPSNSGQITSDLAALVSRQRPDGGWPWCVEALCTPDPNVTAWVLFALGEARRDELEFDKSGISRAGTYLSGYINRTADVANPVDPNQKAFMLAAIAAADSSRSAISPAKALFEQYCAQLNNWGRAYLAMALVDSGVEPGDGQVRALLNDIAAATIPSANGNHWEDAPIRGMFMTHTATTGLVTLALARIQPEQPLLAQSARWLVIARGEQRWVTPVERAHAILALTSYAVATGELGGEFNYRVTVDGRQILGGLVKQGEPLKDARKDVPLADFEPGKVSLVAFLRDFERQGRLYYTMNLRYLTPAKEVEAVNRGFAISHEYSLLDRPGEKIAGAKLGDVVRVKVTVMLPADRYYAVIEDLLPAGLEAIDARLQTTDPALIARLDAERRTAETKQLGGYMAPWFGWYYSPWQHTEIRDDRVVLRASFLPKGVYEYTYYTRATTPGDFFVAPAHAEETYLPEVFGRSDSGRFMVTE